MGAAARRDYWRRSSILAFQTRVARVQTRLRRPPRRRAYLRPALLPKRTHFGPERPVLRSRGFDNLTQDRNPLPYDLRPSGPSSTLPRERFSGVLGMLSSLEVKVLYPT